MNKHYPADFGSERLTQRLVEQIFKKVDANDKLTKVKELDSQPSVASTDPMHGERLLYRLPTVPVEACILVLQACACVRACVALQ